MKLIERIFIITDVLFPAKKPAWERKKLENDIASLSSGVKDGRATILLDHPPEEAIGFLEIALEKGVLTPLIVAPVAFQEHYQNRPYYSALVTLLAKNGYSLFNLYNVAWRRGQIQTAYALFINQELRDAFVKRIQV